jgi:hypothetical protein
MDQIEVQEQPEQQQKNQEQQKVRVLTYGLRQLAALYEAHPELPTPTSMWRDTGYSFVCYLSDDADVKAIASALGSFTKKYQDNDFIMEKNFSLLVQLRFLMSRGAVCKRKVVGKKVEPEQYVPGYLRPAREVEVVEWDCAEPLLSPEAPEAPKAPESIEAEEAE